MALVKGMRHTGIICDDIQQSLIFYRDYLGLSVIQDFWDESEYINKITGITNGKVHMIKMKADDGTIIELLDYESHPADLITQEIYSPGACHLALEVHDISLAYSELLAKGVKFISEPVLSSEGIAKVCFCFDPNKTRIELVEML